jgi:hypothetical protein
MPPDLASHIEHESPIAIWSSSAALGVMKAGPGGNYIQAFRDKDGKHFDGGKS